MTTIRILVTMDVEPALPADRPEGATGPRDYEDSERFIRGYVDLAAQHGYPVTFMIHPEVTHAHAALFDRLERAGACLGLHLHPWKFADGHYKAHFGGLSRAQQYCIVSEATAMWYAGMKRRPRWFRPGTFSANDSTFSVLAELGFLGGSVSLPGRVYPDMCAVWAGTEPDPHFAHPTFRLLPGDLDFVNIPLSVDMSRLEERDGNRFHWDLRPDWQAADYGTIADNIVAQVLARAPAVPVIQIVTHNDNDFTNATDRVARNFATVLQAVSDACRRHGADPLGATFADVAEALKTSAAAPRSFRYAHTSMLTG